MSSRLSSRATTTDTIAALTEAIADVAAARAQLRAALDRFHGLAREEQWTLRDGLIDHLEVRCDPAQEIGR